MLALLPLWALVPDVRADEPTSCGAETALLHRRLDLDKLQARTGGRWVPRLLPSARLFLIHLWAVECGPCVAELPRLLAMMRHYGRAPQLQFLLVSESEDEAKEQELLGRLRAAELPDANLSNATHVRDPEGGLRRSLQSHTQPFTLIVDEHRVIRQVFIGSLLRRRAELAQSLDLLLGALSEVPKPSGPGTTRGSAARQPPRGS